MKKTTFSHSLLSLCLLFLISILGGGNAVNAQSYQLVTSADELFSGDKYLIVNKDNKKALSATQGSNNRSAVAITFDSEGNISTVPSDVCVLELQAQDGGTWAFYDASNSGYLYAASSGSNHLKTQSILDDNGKAIITVTSEGVATITFQGSNTRNLLKYNSSSKIFSCYSSGQQVVYLYHYVNSATGTDDPEISFDNASYVVASNGILPTLSNPHNLSVSYSVTGDVVSVAGDGSVQLTGKTGTATVTASTPQDDTYAAGEVSYSLTVFGAPEITPESGEYAQSVDVTISATDAAALWYTTDGSEPKIDNAAAIKVTEFPVNLSLPIGEHTIKAISAYDAEGTILSNVETRTYTVSDMVSATVEKSSPFTATSGALDAIISYTTAQEDSTTPPALNNGNIRLYQSNSGGHGGSITFTAKEGYEIKSVTIGTAQETTYTYTLDESTEHSAKTNLAANEKATLGGLSNQSVTFYCEGATKYNRFDVNYISVTYASTATGATDPDLSYSPSSLSIAANGTLTQPTLNKHEGVTIQSYFSDNTSVATVTNEGVIALAGGTGTATITATSQADDTYKEGTATYTLTVFGAPEITPESGTYENSVNVVMNATDAGALFYTTDGTDPRDNIDAATMVTEFPCNLPLSAGTHTIKAVTADENLEVYSDVLTREYTVVVAVPTPQLSKAAGNYNYEVAVDVTVTNAGGAVGYVYTTDGTDPATSETATTVNALTGTVTLYKGEHTLTVKSFTAEKANFSEAATAAYTVTLPQPVITLSAESTQDQPIMVTIEAEGAPYIWYTTDGSDPLATGVTPEQVEGSSTSFTLTEVGTYTITAVGVNNNVETSDAATATCTISKVVPVPGSAAMKYKKVTSEDDIVDGGVYILVCEDEGGALETIVSGDRGKVASVSLTDNMYEGETNGSGLPYEIMLEAQADGTYALYSKQDEGGYICSGGGSTKNLFFRTQKDENAYWNISLTQGYNNVKIVSTTTKTSATSDTYKEIRYNPNGGSPLFRPYSSSTGNTVQLYKKTFDLSVNANTAGYATAYTTFPYVMPTGANGYIVTETAEGETIKAKQKYPAGAEVPAHAPLLIKNADAGVTLNPVVLGKTVEAYNYVASNEEAVAAGDVNLLYGTRLESDGVTTDVDGTDNYYYYKLSYKLEAGNPVADSYGFYRGKADGSAFEMKNTLTAYLALSKSSGLVNNLRISIDNEDGPTTGIQANRLPADNMPQSVYTLSGVRVNAEGCRLPKGIYIVNGKKVVIK